MVDPLTIVNGALGITTNAILLCKQTYELVNGTRKAPGYMTRVPGGLRGLLPIFLKMMDNILELVESCVDITEEIGNQINPDLGFDGRGRKGKWRAFKFENFKKSDYNRLNESLANYKTSLDLAVSLFSWDETTQLCVESRQFYVNSRQGHVESTQLYKEMEANMQYLSARLDKLELLTDQSGGDGGPADATISDPSALVLPMRRFLERTSSILSSRSGSSRRALRTERPTPGDSLPFLSAFNAKSEDRSTGNISDTIGRGPARRRKSTAPASTFTQNIPESPIDESESAMKIEEHPYSTRIQVTGKCAVEPS